MEMNQPLGGDKSEKVYTGYKIFSFSLCVISIIIVFAPTYIYIYMYVMYIYKYCLKFPIKRVANDTLSRG